MDVEVRKLRGIYASVVVSFVAGCLVFYAIFTQHLNLIDMTTALWAVLFFLLIAVLHEFVHYAVAKKYNPEATIRVIPRLGGLLLDYVRLDYNQYVKTALAPLFFIQVPLTVAWILSGDIIVLTLTVAHLLASAVDIVCLFSAVISHRGATFNMVYDEKGRVVGVVVERGDKIIFYQL